MDNQNSCNQQYFLISVFLIELNYHATVITFMAELLKSLSH